MTGQRQAAGNAGARAALAGVVAAAAGFAVAELVAAVVAPGSSPLFAAGAGVVDAVPGPLKDWAVATFGTADKAVLLGVMGVVLAAGAAFSGWLELRRPPAGALLLAAVGSVGALVAATRPGGDVAWALPSLVGVGVAVLLLRATLRTLRGPAVSSGSDDATTTPGGLDRRRFLLVTGLAAAAGVVALATSRAVSAGSRAVTAARDALRLPAPATPAPAVPAGADLRVPGLAPYVTPNADFYRIDTALRVPQVDPASWTLRVSGLVDDPFEITLDELLALPLVEHDLTLTCVSNEVGGDLVGNARWLGYPVRELLARAGVQDGADMVLSTSADGWTASTPLDALTDPDRASLLAVGMNGEALPAEHGFPARLVVPGLYGYVSATKWVTELKVTTFADDVAYWSTRGWSERGPIKLASRVDTPRDGAAVDAGDVVVAGVAWAQHTGVEGVEVRVDDGPWRAATLAATVGPDTWRQWSYAWDATPGEHRLTVRATDAHGRTQTADVAPPAPDGASGWHEVAVRVR
ncbi:MAG: molybdopterin-dependent oxidoreductase [Cellulosimicrobium funkei]|uniref:Oxidoreductase n=2 Tax=Cellulosimicrobium TaxID=157920 RepID=A0AAV5P913_CELCE|nr:molybdopterin-dependent oxidoreductase [Cellulosimicrobium cellulans]QDP75382.1 molybdopterin-dependent oxidoreductase [Cellulosimicrobium cellulans]GLY56780.1 putative oxidoreductase [Cellulosimicrobium cellulans]